MKINSINVTNLNNISTKYELIYDVCNNVDCNETSKNLPDNIIISYHFYYFSSSPVQSRIPPISIILVYPI